MFDLEKSISEWRAWMKADGIKAPAVLDELEGHLRDDIQARMKLGSEGREAFEAGVQQIGLAAALRSEFMKAGVRNWNRPLAYVAWIVFAVSFILPSYNGGSGWNGAPGWQCAILQCDLWDSAISGQWTSIHYELLTLANLLMLASPFLLFRFSTNSRVVTWFRSLTLVSLLLVWSYVALIFVLGDWQDLRIGCFVWATSFMLLFVSMWERRRKVVQYV